MFKQTRNVLRDARSFANNHPFVTYVAVRVLTPPPVQVALLGVWITAEAYDIYRAARQVSGREAVQ